MKKRTGFPEIAEAVLGILIYLIPIVCGIYILSWAGRAYHEGYNLFAEESLDSPATAHSELITVSESEAGSALAVGRILEKQNLVSQTREVRGQISSLPDKESHMSDYERKFKIHDNYYSFLLQKRAESQVQK